MRETKKRGPVPRPSGTAKSASHSADLLGLGWVALTAGLSLFLYGRGHAKGAASAAFAGVVVLMARWIFQKTVSWRRGPQTPVPTRRGLPWVNWVRLLAFSVTLLGLENYRWVFPGFSFGSEADLKPLLLL